MTAANGWPQLPLAEIARPVPRPVAVVPGKSYRTLGVKWWGEGAYERQTIDGSQTAATVLNEVREDDLIINKIWVRHGSVAIVGPDVHGCMGSNEFPTFELLHDRVLPRWLHWYSKTQDLWNKCDALSQGTSGKNRIRPERFLTIQIPLPPLDEQRRIVAKIERVAAKIELAKQMQKESALETESFCRAELRKKLQELSHRSGEFELGGLLTEAGYGTSVKCEYERQSDSIPVLRIPNVASETINFDALKFGVLSKGDLKKATLTPGDILVVRTNGSADLVGRAAVVPALSERTGFASYLIRLRVDQTRVAPHYLHLVLKHLRTEGYLFDFARTTAGQYNVSLGRIWTAKIPMPPLPEQEKLVADLGLVQAQTDRILHAQSENAKKLNALLPTILDRAFKGAL
jgi:type I restriction enzyme S subunit